MHGVSKVRAKLSFLCIICSLGQVEFSLYKFNICPGERIKFCYFHTPDFTITGMAQAYKCYQLRFRLNKIFQLKIVNIFLPINFNICFGCSKEPYH